ncbi:MAG: amino acid adenylation domain-containing protein, partial [Blastocatellia bacterium]|nr:amino acid adenylation domain-containing protein [Blastocatellia bacterium]
MLEQADGGRAYRVQFAVLIEGELDRAVLRQAIESVEAGCDILRTNFVSTGWMALPLQVIAGQARLSVAEYELSHQDKQPPASIDSLFQEARVRPFHLERESLLHIQLIEMAERRHILLLSLPSLCADAAGAENLVRKVCLSYAARLEGKEKDDGAIPYIHISEWLHELLESEQAEVGKDYWRKQNATAFRRIELPFEKRGLDATSFAPEHLAFTMDADFTASIVEAVGVQKTTFEAFLLTCLHVLLWRLTGEPDTESGVLFDGRTDEELEGVIGLLARYLPVNLFVDGGARFDHLLPGVCEILRRHYRWQECFSAVEPGLKENGSNQAFASICFDYSERPTQYCASGVSWSIEKRYSCLDRFKMRLSFLKRADHLVFDLYYDSNVIAAKTAKRFGESFMALLRSASAAPHSLVCHLEVLDESHRHRLLVEFNHTREEFPTGQCVHHLFEQQVKRTPDKAAVVFEGEKLTYSQLNEKANRLANHLLRAGVGPDTLVGVCLERSLEMVIAIFGTLKAGGAYVPLDPAYPKDRLALMIEDSGAAVLLTQSHLEEVCSNHVAQVICIDKDWREIESHSGLDPSARVSEDNLAYVIYTSGSTGRPKGVMIPHRALVNHMLWMQARFPLTEQDAVMQRTPFSFDASVWEFYAPLLAGARLVMVRPGDHQDSAYMVKLIQQEDISSIQMVPSLLGIFLEEPELERCVSLKRVYSGGEQLWADIKHRLAARLKSDLCNLYGPTEACIQSTFWVCGPEDDHRKIPIGKPIKNVRVYVLDQYLQPVPVYTTGEIYISGEG